MKNLKALVVFILVFNMILLVGCDTIDTPTDDTPIEQLPNEDDDNKVSFVDIFKKCEHAEMGTKFAFQFENSTAYSHHKPYCKNCNQYFGYTLFRGTPSDLSYLEVVKEYIVEDEIVGGEYYTMTATVTLPDYNTLVTRIDCKVENEDIKVYFSVEFQEEFEELVSSLQEGDEITFRGRLYDEGFGFTDCELVQ